MARKTTASSYDYVPYPSLVYTDTHPGKLATLARLFGIKSPPIAKCRILELGCGDGTNLIAIAQSLPRAECWGIDFSAKQIAMGQSMIDAIPLSNITLKHLNFLSIDESLGQFDYIIAHGVYSWVPKEMQDTLLSLIKRHLVDNGIAYISYNIYPGWHMENIVRDMMMYHTQQLPKLSFQMNMMQARGIVQFLANLRQQGGEVFDVLLQEKVQQLQTMEDNYLYHDFLEADNYPVYFHQFIEHITPYRLGYVTDIEFRHYLMLSFPPQVVEAMEELFQEDFFKKEQYMDFFYNRTLRRSLLCHKKMPVTRELDWKVVPDFYIATTLQAEKVPVKLDSDEPAQFKKVDGEIVTVTHSLTKVALLYLTQQYPQRISFKKLFKYVSRQLPKSYHKLTSRELVAKELLYLYCHEAVEFYVDSSPYAISISASPTASPLARVLATKGQQPLINLRCEFIHLSPTATALLPYLTGKNDRQALLNILTNIMENKATKPINLLLDEILAEILQGGLLVA
jgi:methyltransferase-like protein/2-polyprenyl-3-methyl-5-hydroxy-6-metoxy-1,4-benzoquinol methylase